MGLTHIFFHPDYTVGSGVTPDLLTLPDEVWQALAGLTVAGLTAGGESHPAPKTYCCAGHMTGGNTLAQMKKPGRAGMRFLFGKVAWEKQFSLSYF